MKEYDKKVWKIADELSRWMPGKSCPINCNEREDNDYECDEELYKWLMKVVEE